jgi:hypothetical protein
MINVPRGAIAAFVFCAALVLAAPVAQAKVHHHHRHAVAAAGHVRRHHAARRALRHALGHGLAHRRRAAHRHPAITSHRRHAALCQSVRVRGRWVQHCRG